MKKFVKAWTGLHQLSDTCMTHFLNSANQRVKREFLWILRSTSFSAGFPLRQLWYGIISDGHDERFCKDRSIAIMEQRYNGKWSTTILADYYCWTLQRCF